jgi:hypothetical protein
MDITAAFPLSPRQQLTLGEKEGTTLIDNVAAPSLLALSLASGYKRKRVKNSLKVTSDNEPTQV